MDQFEGRFGLHGSLVDVVEVVLFWHLLNKSHLFLKKLAGLCLSLGELIQEHFQLLVVVLHLFFQHHGVLAEPIKYIYGFLFLEHLC